MGEVDATLVAVHEGIATAEDMLNSRDSEKNLAQMETESLQQLKKYFDGGRGRGKAVKTVRNATLASGCPYAPLTAARGVGGGAKITAENVKSANRGGSGGGTKTSPSGEGGRLLIGSGAEIIREIGAAYYNYLIPDSALLAIGTGRGGGLREHFRSGEGHVRLGIISV